MNFAGRLRLADLVVAAQAIQRGDDCRRSDVRVLEIVEAVMVMAAAVVVVMPSYSCKKKDRRRLLVVSLIDLLMYENTEQSDWAMGNPAYNQCWENSNFLKTSKFQFHIYFSHQKIPASNSRIGSGIGNWNSPNTAYNLWIRSSLIVSVAKLCVGL